MTTLAFDTLQVVEVLKDHGYDETQAKGIVEVLQSARVEGAPTVKDFASLGDQLGVFRNESDKSFAVVEAKIDSIQKVSIAIFVTLLAGIALQLFG